MPDLLFFLLLGHYLGDFALQSDEVAQLKPSSRVILTYHVAYYTLVITLSLLVGLIVNNQEGFFTTMTLTVILSIFATHWIQDLIKGLKFNGTKQAFFVDQALHVLVLFLVRILIYHG